MRVSELINELSKYADDTEIHIGYEGTTALAISVDYESEWGWDLSVKPAIWGKNKTPRIVIESDA